MKRRDDSDKKEERRDMDKYKNYRDEANGIRMPIRRTS